MEMTIILRQITFFKVSVKLHRKWKHALAKANSAAARIEQRFENVTNKATF